MNNRSCLSNILHSIDTINEYLAEGNCTDIFYFDFKKAFDSVPHNRLLTKLSAYGIPEKMVNIIRDFLSNRNMVVKVGDSYSAICKVVSGVPQGSVLGPCYFLFL